VKASIGVESGIGDQPIGHDPRQQRVGVDDFVRLCCDQQKGQSIVELLDQGVDR
jgi:hypothetical protein